MSKLELENLRFDVTDLKPFWAINDVWHSHLFRSWQEMSGASVIFISYHVFAYHYFYYNFCVPLEHCFSFENVSPSHRLSLIVLLSGSTWLVSIRWRGFRKLICATKFTYSNGKDNCFRAPWLRPIHHPDICVCVSEYSEKRIHII